MKTKRSVKKGLMYDPLDAREFKRRMEDSFSPVYLTSISIIQGVALGLLCQQVFSQDQQNNTGLIEPAAFYLYVVMSFVTIVGVSYEYNWFVGMHRWSQKFLDTLIPFALGFFEIGAIFNLAQPHRWWLLIAAFSVVGAIAFWNTWNNCKAEMFADRQLFQYFKRSIRSSIITSLVAAVYCFGVGAVYSSWRNNLPWYWVDLPTAVLYIVMFSVLLWKDHKFVEGVHAKLRLLS